ncbi:MAG: PHP domain-containing protein [Gemmatimonadaceae bacterium]
MTAPGATAPHVDLHSHSTASDGAVSPTVAVQTAHRAGIAALALTDHDTIGGIAEAAAAAASVGMRLVVGAELSAHDGDREIHLLALHLARRDVIESALLRFREQRVARAEEIVGLLQGQGVNVTFDAVLAAAAGGAVGRPHVARAMIAAGAVRDHREAFDRYLALGRPAFVDKAYLAIGDAVALVHEAGGLAVFAHPGGDGTRDRVERLRRQGLDGLEVLHPSHGAGDVSRLGALVDHFGMVRSGGSDWHGAAEGPRTLGAMRVPMAWLEAQDALLARRATAGAD